ncbi:MAG: polysaccharide biosynthesis protein [Geobacteraceae bacterium]|nr:polysaccharide biosynthesis protein [Geobacteraceae bacterium]
MSAHCPPGSKGFCPESIQFRLLSGNKYVKGMLVLMVDVAMIAIAFSMAFLLRFDFHIPVNERELFLKGLCIVLITKPAVFLCLGFYRNIWRYASIQDAVKIIKAVSLSSVIAAFVIAFYNHFAPFPRSIIVLDWFLLLTLVSASRLAWRLWRDTSQTSKQVKGRRALIVGAGKAGSLLLQEFRRMQVCAYDIIGFVDDDQQKQGMYLNDVPVIGTQEDIQALVKKFGIEEIIIAIPSVRGMALRTIVERCSKAGVCFKTVPSIGEIIDGNISISQIKDVEIDDLLGRPPVVLDERSIGNYLTNMTVLVSGAAGSIGSEICRQVARFMPERLIILDHAETPLFYIERELRAKHPGMRIIPALCDIRNKEKIEMVFAEFNLDVVFHAAAYKHVSIMEDNPMEAVSNNIGGTRIMADAANRFGVRDFVMISTDKAVNPTNVMGASKRVAEIYVQALSRRSATNFSTVRFGNVLGSNGSVIPLFMEQIRKGGPVTVTDPAVVRYFMTIPEAAQLVLQAGCLGKGGEIFVLDMGEPVRIINLAEELIKLSGLIPYEDIDVVFTGLRPGEKLFEELLIAGEGIMPTIHEKIRIAAAVAKNLDVVNTELNHLLQRAKEADIAGIVKCLHRMVTDFTPSQQLIKSSVSGVQLLRTESLPENNMAPSSAKIIYFHARNATQDSTAANL